MADEIGVIHVVNVEAGATVPPEGHLLYARDTDDIFKSDGTTLSAMGGGAAYTNEEAQDAVGAMIDASLVYVDATPLLSRAALTGDVTAAQGSNSTTIANDAVTDAKLRESAALSVIGRSANSTGNPADIVGSTVGHVLQVLSGPTVGWGGLETTISQGRYSWDNPPVSPHAYDDEFDSGTLDSKWTITSSGTTNPATSGTIDYTASLTTPIVDASSVPGWLTMQSDNSSLGYVSVYQSYSPSTDATFFARFGWNCRAVTANGEGNVQVVLSSSSDANEEIDFGIFNNGTQSSPYLQVQNNGAFTAVFGQVTLENIMVPSVYLAVWKKSDVYYLGQATDSKGIFSLIGSVTKTGVTTFDRISLRFRTANETPSIIDGFDFFRYKDSLDYSLVNPPSVSLGTILIDDIGPITDNRLLGRSAGSDGAIQEITVGTGLSLSAGALTNSVSAFTTEDAQDAVGAMVDASLTYVDGTPLLQRAALTGDVTAAAGSNATSIANDAVTYAKIQNVTDARLIGRSAGSAGDAQEITVGAGLTLSGGSLVNSGGTYTDEQAQDAIGAMVDTTLEYTDGTPLLSRAALTGDVTAAAGSNATTIANDAVTFAKMQNIGTGRLLGRYNASSGNVEEISLGTGLSLNPGTGELVYNLPTKTIGVTFDGNGSTPTVGSIGYAVCPFTGTITGWNIVSDAVGSAVVDVWKDVTIPTNADTIAGSEKPTLTAQQLNSDLSLTTWSTLSVAPGDVIGFELESVTTCTRVTAHVVITEG